MAHSSSNLIRKNKLDKMVQILKAVANPVRLQIVNILVSGECQVGELVNTLGTKPSLTSQQLRIFKYAGVLKSRRDGNKVYYYLASDSIKRIVESIIKEFDKIS